MILRYDMATSSHAIYGPTSPSQTSSNTRLGAKKPQYRQPLSCTKCRDRKVKCDRTKPCSACCMRGHPRECEFIVGEGNDYGPIQQSYELRKLRQENQRLKARLQAACLPHSDDEAEQDATTERRASRQATRASVARQRGYKSADRVDNLYFGTPGLPSIVTDFAALGSGPHSLTHAIPHARDAFVTGYPAYPFPIVERCSSTVELLSILPKRDELFERLKTFEQRAQGCSFPYLPEEMSRKEVERFLDDAEDNAVRTPDMLALLLVTLAAGCQLSHTDDKAEDSDRDSAETTNKKGDVFLAASMQALRNGSYMSQPTLLGIQTLIMMGPYLNNSDRYLDGWTLFGTTIRLAHSIGLHRNPQFLSTVPDRTKCALRQILWWWMLHMDQQYAITLGRPLGISGLGDCPPPHPLTTDTTMLRLNEFMHQYTLLARQILSSDGMMSAGKIDDFTKQLLDLWDTMPETLQFNESWSRKGTVLPEWPLEVISTKLFMKIHTLIVLLSRQRRDHAQLTDSRYATPIDELHSIDEHHSSQRSISDRPMSAGEPSFRRSSRNGRDLMVNAAARVLRAFIFFRLRCQSVLTCWTIGQQAYNACLVLIMDALEEENEANERLIDKAYVVFTELERDEVHTLAGVAVAQVSEGIQKLGQRRDERKKAKLEREEQELKQERARAMTMELEMSRRSSTHGQRYQEAGPTDSTCLFRGDTDMGDAADPDYEHASMQPWPQQAYQPFIGWEMLGIGNLSHTSASTTPALLSPTLPIDHISSANFPTSFIAAPSIVDSTYGLGGIPNAHDHFQFAQAQHFAHQQQQLYSHGSIQQPDVPSQAFTPINDFQPDEHTTPVPPSHQHYEQQQRPTSQQQHQHQQYPPSHPQQQPQNFHTMRPRRLRTNAAASGHFQSAAPSSRATHRIDKTPRSQQRQ